MNRLEAASTGSAFGTAGVCPRIVPGAQKIVIDCAKGPWVTLPLLARSNCEIVFEDGAEIRARRGAFLGKRDRLFTLMGVSNVTVRGEGALGGGRVSDWEVVTPRTRRRAKHTPPTSS